MSCIISEGYDLGCFGTGGVKNVWIANYTSSATFHVDATGVITGSAGAGTFYKFEQDIESAAFNESVPVSRENGTVYYESTLTIKMFNNDAATRNLFKAVAKAPLRTLIEDNNGNHWLMGLDTAVRASEGTRGFGQSFGDMNGGTLTFMYKSAEPVPVVASAIVGSDIVLG